MCLWSRQSNTTWTQSVECDNTFYFYMIYCDAAPQTKSDWGIIRAPIWNINLNVPVFVHKSLFWNTTFFWSTTLIYNFNFFLLFFFPFLSWNPNLMLSQMHSMLLVLWEAVDLSSNVSWKGPFLCKFSNNVWKQKNIIVPPSVWNSCLLPVFKVFLFKSQKMLWSC